MQRLVVCLFVAFLGGFAIQANLNAQGAAAYLNRGNAWSEKGEYDKAIDAYTDALEMNPRLTAAYNNRGRAWQEKGEYDKAIADYNQTLAIKPKDADAYGCRGSAYVKKREYDKAIADYSHAVKLAPDDAHAYNNLAWPYATCRDERYRDGKKAVENATKAYGLDGGKNWRCVGALAAAYAESGDFDKAKEWGLKAVEMATADMWASDDDKSEASTCLELYKRGKPCRK